MAAFDVASVRSMFRIRKSWKGPAKEDMCWRFSDSYVEIGLCCCW